MTSEGALLWTPSPERVARSNIAAFQAWLMRERGVQVADYHALWRWSVDDIEAFWAAIWDYFAIDSPTPPTRVLGRCDMPGAEWFAGASVNYGAHILRNATPDRPALLAQTEGEALRPVAWADFAAAVRRFAEGLRRVGVAPGDRVASVLPNVPEAAIALTACATVGAVWTSCAPEFGVAGIVDRFAQLAPKVLLVSDGYPFGGKWFDRRSEGAELVRLLPSVKTVVHLSRRAGIEIDGAIAWPAFLADDPGASAFVCEAAPFDHPLWVLFSSGTTGIPKAIVHSHGGVTLELSKTMAFHLDLHPGERMFFYATTGWVVWNIVVSALLVGATPLLYDGHPAFPEPDALWRLAETSAATVFGVSPTYVQQMIDAGVRPRDRRNLSRLECIFLSGSPATPESMAWCYDAVKEDVWVASQSGGTDVASGFVGASPTLPVYAGEIQCPMLGVDVVAFDDAGRETVGELGELVVRQPMPSMPLRFWNDPDDRRYRESYFEAFPGVWRHGDFLKINSRGGCYIYGRSDATLNRYGVRIGAAEIYRIVDGDPAVADSLIVSLDLPGGGFFMPLFVALRDGVSEEFAEIDTRLRTQLRQGASPRHVPDRIVRVSAIPFTLTGKKMEVPVKRILMGANPVDVANRDAMRDPAALDAIVAVAASLRAELGLAT